MECLFAKAVDVFEHTGRQPDSNLHAIQQKNRHLDGARVLREGNGWPAPNPQSFRSCDWSWRHHHPISARFQMGVSQTNKTPSKVDMVVLVPLLIGSVLLVLMVLWASLSVLIDTWTKGEEMGVIQWIMLFILPCSALPSIWLYRTMTNRK